MGKGKRCICKTWQAIRNKLHEQTCRNPELYLGTSLRNVAVFEWANKNRNAAFLGEML